MACSNLIHPLIVDTIFRFARDSHMVCHIETESINWPWYSQNRQQKKNVKGIRTKWVEQRSCMEYRCRHNVINTLRHRVVISVCAFSTIQHCLFVYIPKRLWPARYIAILRCSLICIFYYVFFLCFALAMDF